MGFNSGFKGLNTSHLLSRLKMRGVISLLPPYMSAWRREGNFTEHLPGTSPVVIRENSLTIRPVFLHIQLMWTAMVMTGISHYRQRGLFLLRRPWVSSYQMSRLSTAGREKTKTFVSVCLSCVKITVTTWKSFAKFWGGGGTKLCLV